MASGVTGVYDGDEGPEEVGSARASRTRCEGITLGREADTVDAVLEAGATLGPRRVRAGEGPPVDRVAS